MGVADATAFNFRASALERGWLADESAGIPPAELAAARLSLHQLQARRVGPLPYAIFSGALLFDPFAGAEAQAVNGARRHAEDSLARLRQAGGPNFDAR